MDFEWDEAKNQSNLAKHGVGFDVAYGFDWDNAGYRLDDRFDYGEQRMLAYGIGQDGESYVVAFTIRNDTYRIISVRRFGRKDHRFYDPPKSEG
jgi:uncharacterized protein